MADISTELANIMSAIYGEEVRGSIHDAIEKMNTQLNAAISGTLNGLGFRGDYSSGTLDQLNTENDRGIWRLLPSGTYTEYPEDYQKSRGGLLFVYVNGSYCRQELRYYKLTENTGADSSKVWTRTLSGGEGIFSDFTDWIVEAPLSFKGDYRNGASLNALTNDADKGIYRLLGSSTYSGMPSDYVQNVSGYLTVYVFGTNVVQELKYISNFDSYELMTWKRVYTGSWGEWEKNTDSTLTKSGAAADAKAVGDIINNLNIPTIDATLAIDGKAADAKAVGDKALISKQVYLPVGDNANLNNFYTQGIYSVMAPQGTQNWPFENTSGLFIVLNANNDLGTFITYAVAQIAICEGKYAFRSSVVGQSGPKYSDWVIYSIDDTLSVEGAAADAKAVGDAISGAVENVVSSKGLAMSTDPEHPVKDLNDYKTPGIYYAGVTRVTNWAFDDNYKGVLVVFNPMTNAEMDEGVVQMAFSNGEFAYRVFKTYAAGGTDVWSDWIKNDNSRLLNIIESIAEVDSVQNEIDATANQNYYLEKMSATTCTVKSSTGTNLVIYSVAVEAKKNYRITASNVASIDNAILAFATRALADNVGCTMLIDNTGGPTIDYSYSPTQDGYLFLSKGTNSSMTYKIYEIEEKAIIKTDKDLSTEDAPADAKAAGEVPYKGVTFTAGEYWREDTNNPGKAIINIYPQLNRVTEIPVKAGEKVYLDTTGYSYGYPYFIVDSSYNILSDSGRKTIYKGIVDVTDSDAAYILVNCTVDYTTKLKVVKGQSNNLNAEFINHALNSAYNYEHGKYWSVSANDVVDNTEYYETLNSVEPIRIKNGDKVYIKTTGYSSGKAYFIVDKNFISLYSYTTANAVEHIIEIDYEDAEYLLVNCLDRAIDDLKIIKLTDSNFNDKLIDSDAINDYRCISGKYWKLTNGVVDSSGVHNNLSILEPISAKFGDKFLIRTHGYSSAVPYYIVDKDFNPLYTENKMAINKIISVDYQNAAFLLVNVVNTEKSNLKVTRFSIGTYNSELSTLLNHGDSYVDGHYWSVTDGIASETTTYSALNAIYPIPVSKGDAFYIRTTGYSRGKGYFITDEDYRVLYTENELYVDKIVSISYDNAAYLLVNCIDDALASLKIVKFSRTDFNKEVAGLKDDLKVVYPTLKAGYTDYTTGVYGSYGDNGKLTTTEDFITVIPGGKCYFHVRSRGSYDGYAFYDDNYTYISGGSSSERIVDTPSNATYVKFSNYNIVGKHEGVYAIIASKLGGEVLLSKQIKICCTGDSVTEGMALTGAHDSMYGCSPYPARLETILVDNGYSNIEVVNQGHGGERLTEVATRIGGAPCYFAEDVTIPADGSAVSLGTATVTNGRVRGTKLRMPFAGYDGEEYCICYTQTANDTNPLIIDGTSYTMTVNASSTENSIRKTVNDNESSVIKAGTFLYTNNDKCPTINVIFAGYNDRQGLTLSNWLDIVKRSGEANGGKYIIIGSTHPIWLQWADLTGTDEEKRNKYLVESMKVFGIHFIDLYKEFFEHAMDYALEAGYFTDKTSDQISEMRSLLSQHIVPAEFSYDKAHQGNAHLSEEGYHVIALLIFERLKRLGYI